MRNVKLSCVPFVAPDSRKTSFSWLRKCKAQSRPTHFSPPGQDEKVLPAPSILLRQSPRDPQSSCLSASLKLSLKKKLVSIPIWEGISKLISHYPFWLEHLHLHILQLQTRDNLTVPRFYLPLFLCQTQLAFGIGSKEATRGPQLPFTLFANRVLLVQ